MRVWIVMKGEKYEGGYVDAVYAEERDAKAYYDAEVKRLIQRWKEVYDGRPGYIEARMEVGASSAWVCCDTIRFFPQEVL